MNKWIWLIVVHVKIINVKLIKLIKNTQFCLNFLNILAWELLLFIYFLAQEYEQKK